MRRLCFLLLFVASPAVCQPASLTAAQKAKMGEYDQCIVRAAKVLDDGRSDAATIVRGLRSYCIMQQRAMLDAWAGDGRPDLNKSIMDAKLDRDIEAVLQWRASKSGTRPQ